MPNQRLQHYGAKRAEVEVRRWPERKIMGNLKYTDVFVPGGFPRHTYNPRLGLNLEATVRQVTDNLCKLVPVTGHTKSGKTVLVRSILPREDAIWVDGGGVGDEEDFWTTVIDQLDLFQTTEVAEEKEKSAELSASGTAGANFLVAKGEAEIGGTYSTARRTSATRSRSVSARVSALAGLRAAKRAIVIDDFHYLPRELQGELVRALKPLVFDGLPVVIIAIPHLGSPHLMQEFCRAICKAHGITTSFGGKSADSSDQQLTTVFAETADTIGRPIFEKLARGPRQRSDRIARKLKSGQDVDIYGLVLHALAKLRPGLIVLAIHATTWHGGGVGDAVPDGGSHLGQRHARQHVPIDCRIADRRPHSRHRGWGCHADNPDSETDREKLKCDRRIAFTKESRKTD
jgi:hypothetical protein